VNGDDVPNDDMPNFLRPAPRDGLPFNDPALAALLAGTEPPESTPGLQHVADVLAALRSGPTGDELAGEASVLTEFRRGTGMPEPSPGSRRPRRLTSLLGTRAAVAAAVAALSLGGLATAAYAGMLPAPVQRLAHDAIGAPAVPSGSPSRAHQNRSRTSAGPGAAGLTAQRWCTAYAHGTVAQRAAARHNLIRAAGGAGKIAEYCRTAAHPGNSGAHSGGKGASPGNHGKGGSQSNHGEGSSNGNQGNGASHSNQGKSASGGNQGKSASGGNQGKSASGGNQGKSASGGNQYRHHAAQSKGKSSAHSGAKRGKHDAPRASRRSAYTTPHATGRSPRARR
jgi:hypothetical protein